MARFKYTAKTAEGALVKDFLDTDNEAALYAALKEKGLFLIDYKMTDRRKDLLSSDKAPGKLSLRQLSVFCSQISAMLGSGVSLVKAIDILYQQSFDKKMKRSLKLIYESVQKGEMLSEGMKRQTGVFPEIMLSMIESGEASGTLDTVMSKLAEQFEADLKLRNKLISSVTYPAILVVLCIGIVTLLIIAVLPTFSGMFAGLGEDLPPLTKALLGLSDTLRAYWYIYVFMLVAIPAGLGAWIKTKPGRLILDEFKLRAPLFGTVTTRLVSVRFCRTFATLFSSGMAMLPAIDIVSRVIGNQIVANYMDNVKEDIRKGVSLSHAISSIPIFPPMVHSMISIGEESGSLDTMLENTARYFDDELSNAIQRMVTFIEPALLVVMGGLVSMIILSIMLPMLSMYEAM